jgi:RecJ-like exonuclease
MNCWVCEGHGDLTYQGNKVKRVVNTIAKEKEKHSSSPNSHEHVICHYCSGSGYIEVTE